MDLYGRDGSGLAFVATYVRRRLDRRRLAEPGLLPARLVRPDRVEETGAQNCLPERHLREVAPRRQRPAAGDGSVR